jgi:hypothetical protein
MNTLLLLLLLLLWVVVMMSSCTSSSSSSAAAQYRLTDGTVTWRVTSISYTTTTSLFMQHMQQEFKL